MNVEVHVVNDDELPYGHDYCFLRFAGKLVFVVKASRATSPWVLREAWIVSRRFTETGRRLLASA